MAELASEADARVVARLRSQTCAGALIITRIHANGAHEEIAAYLGGRNLKL